MNKTIKLTVAPFLTRVMALPSTCARALALALPSTHARGVMALPLIFALLALCSCSRGEYDVYLLIGQSNMAGRGTLLESDFAQGPEEGVFLLDSLDVPVPATHPYNQYSTIRKKLSMQQMGPAYSFGREMHARTGRKVLLVVNARGGTGLDSWLPGEEYFNEAVRRTRAAQQYGELKAIVWHQGCNDASNGLTGTYLDRLSVMVGALRDSLAASPSAGALGAGGQSRAAAGGSAGGKSAAGGQPAAAGGQPAAAGKSAAGNAVPFVAGELGRWRGYAAEFNAMLSAVPECIPNSAVVSSEGCGMLRDESDPHFSRDGQLLLGQRYADAVSRLLER